MKIWNKTPSFNTRDYVMLFVFCIICIGLFIKEVANKNQVKKDYVLTTGHIIDYYIVGEFDTRYLEYKYSVNNEFYTRRINISVDMDTCYLNIKNCTHCNFAVIYSKDKPEHSLINIHRSINEVKDSLGTTKDIDIEDFE